MFHSISRIFLDQIFYKSLTQNCLRNAQLFRLKNLIFEFENLQFLSIDRIQFKFYGCFKMSRLVRIWPFIHGLSPPLIDKMPYYLIIFVSQTLGLCQQPAWPNTGTGKFLISKQQTEDIFFNSFKACCSDINKQSKSMEPFLEMH